MLNHRIILCLTILAASIYALAPQPPKSVEVKVSDTSNLNYGGESFILLDINNHTSSVIKIVGFGPSCSSNCCVAIDAKPPLVLEAGGNIHMTIPCYVKTQGEYLLNTAIYYELNGKTKSHPLIFSGIANYESKTTLARE